MRRRSRGKQLFRLFIVTYPLVREMREHIVGNGQPVMLIRGSYLQDWLAAGHPQGYLGSVNAFVRDAYQSSGGETVRGLPTFRDEVTGSRYH
jgi:hypothetical protein